MPVSQRQLEANRRNALKSTGPRSAAGKARSSRNALKHGFTARTIVLQSESSEDFLALREQWLQEYPSASAEQRTVIEQIAVVLWKLGRLAELEADAFLRQERQMQPPPRPIVEALLRLDRRELSNLAVGGGSVMAHLVTAALRGSPPAPLDREPFEQYSRYEGSLQTKFYRAVRKLRRLQLREERAANNLKREQSQTLAGDAESSGFCTIEAMADLTAPGEQPSAMLREEA